jgi:hypothetical protein
MTFRTCRSLRCDFCGGPRHGVAFCAVRPVQKIFGVKNVPFLFNCCSMECKSSFMMRRDGLSQLLYGSAYDFA